MTKYFSSHDIIELATPSVALAAARTAIDVEAAGLTQLPPRLDTNHENGFLRVMPAVYGDWMGVKVMTLARGVGNRYLVLLYARHSGDLIAVFDAHELTRLRTAATTALAGSLLVDSPPIQIGLIGTGFEASMHLQMLHEAWEIKRATVFGRDPERRVKFAARMSDLLEITVEPVENSAAACGGQQVVVLATKSADPVVDGRDFDPFTRVLSIGSTRPDLRELDGVTMSRAASLVVDDVVQVPLESGDIMTGLRDGDLRANHLLSMASLCSGATTAPFTAERDLVVFKSVGTALQDLALAIAVFEAGIAQGRDLGVLAELKLPS
jgi:alanine dehydrogenase